MSCTAIRLIVIAMFAFLPMTALADSREGPSGGTGGSPFSDSPPPGASIAEIRVRSATRLDAIQVVYRTPGNSRADGEHHGGSGGDPNVLTLGPNEYVTGIRGQYAGRVDSLTILVEGKRADWTGFHVGGNGGEVDFAYDAPPGMEIVGFHGRSGDEIDAIGVILRPRAPQ